MNSILLLLSLIFSVNAHQEDVFEDIEQDSVQQEEGFEDIEQDSVFIRFSGQVPINRITWYFDYGNSTENVTQYNANSAAYYCTNINNECACFFTGLVDGRSKVAKCITIANNVDIINVTSTVNNITNTTSSCKLRILNDGSCHYGNWLNTTTDPLKDKRMNTLEEVIGEGCKKTNFEPELMIIEEIYEKLKLPKSEKPTTNRTTDFILNNSVLVNANDSSIRIVNSSVPVNTNDSSIPIVNSSVPSSNPNSIPVNPLSPIENSSVPVTSASNPVPLNPPSNPNNVPVSPSSNPNNVPVSSSSNPNNAPVSSSSNPNNAPSSNPNNVPVSSSSNPNVVPVNLNDSKTLNSNVNRLSNETVSNQSENSTQNGALNLSSSGLNMSIASESKASSVSANDSITNVTSTNDTSILNGTILIRSTQPSFSTSINGSSTNLTQTGSIGNTSFDLNNTLFNQFSSNYSSINSTSPPSEVDSLMQIIQFAMGKLAEK